MIRRPPRSTLDRSSAASDVYKRQADLMAMMKRGDVNQMSFGFYVRQDEWTEEPDFGPVSYTHLRAHETVLDLVCRLLLEKKKKTIHHRMST